MPAPLNLGVFGTLILAGVMPLPIYVGDRVTPRGPIRPKKRGRNMHWASDLGSESARFDFVAAIARLPAYGELCMDTNSPALA